MKKQYHKPDMRVVRIEHQHIICTSADSNADIIFGDGGSDPARARNFGGWDDEDDWDE